MSSFGQQWVQKLRSEAHGVCVLTATPYSPRLPPWVSVTLKTDSKALAHNPLVFVLQIWCFERAEHANLAYELQSFAGFRISYWRTTWANLCSRNNHCICHELFFWPFFLVGFCTPVKHRTTAVARFHIWFQVLSEVIWITQGLLFPHAASDGAGKHMAQLRQQNQHLRAVQL